MFVVIWEYQVKAEHAAAFEETYSATGVWAKLFHESKSYLGTELLVEEGQPRRYITIDRWTSPQAYESFLSEWKNEYTALDAQSEQLTERETRIGMWEVISQESH